MYEGVVQELIDELGRLPGIGPKSAQRIAFWILSADGDQIANLSNLLREVKERVKFCEICYNVTEESRCAICRDARRSQTVLCVVEESKDVQAIERTREFRGLYHVLGEQSALSKESGQTTCESKNLCLGFLHLKSPR